MKRKVFILIMALFLSLGLSACSVDDLSLRVDNLESRIAANEDDLVDQAALIAQINADITSMNESITTINGLITNIQSDSSDQATLITQINSQITSLTESIVSINSAITDLGSDYDSLSTIVTNLSTSLSELTDAVTALGIADTTIQASIDDLIAQVPVLQIYATSMVSFTQTDDTLSGVYTFVAPVDETIDGYVYQHSTMTLKHPLSAEDGFDPVISTQQLNLATETVDIDVLYHGAYTILTTYVYSNGTDTLTYDEVIEAQFVAANYNIVWLNATMPVLLFATDSLTGVFDNGYTYIDIERARTFDYTKLPDKVSPVPAYASASLGNYDQSQVANFYNPILPRFQYDYAIQWVKELYELDNTSTFNFSCVDNVTDLITSAYLSGIPEANMSFRVYTDGQYTATLINNNYSDLASFNTNKAEFDTWKSDLLDGTNTTINLAPKLILAATIYDNFEYVVNSVAGVTFDTDSVDINLRVVSPAEAFDGVRLADNLIELEYLLKTRWGDAADESMSVYFEGTPTDNLLILGTSPAAELNSAYATFDKYIQYVNATYGDDYKIFYKGHPRYPSDTTRQAMLETNNVVELPSSIPVETLMLLYQNVYVGGYTSTSFQSSEIGQTIFFFGTEALIRGNTTIAAMIDGGVIFANTVYLSKDIDGNVIVG